MISGDIEFHALSDIKWANGGDIVHFTPSAGSLVNNYIRDCLLVITMSKIDPVGYAKFNGTEFIIVKTDTVETAYQRWADNRELYQRRNGWWNNG